MNGGIYYSISTFNRICLVNMCNYLAAYTPLYLEACSNMHALLHAYLVGMEALDLFFVWASVYMHLLSLCALRHNNGSDMCASSELRHNNGSDVCASRECPGETVHLPRLVWVVDVRITDSFVLFVACVSKSFCDFVPEVEAISCLKKPILARYQSIFYTY